MSLSPPSGAILRVYRTGLWAPDRTKTGWVENEDRRPKNKDPLKITYKYLEMGISTLDV